jgi:hypothetical protein
MALNKYGHIYHAYHIIYLRIVISIDLLEAPDEIPRGLVEVLVPLGDAKEMLHKFSLNKWKQSLSVRAWLGGSTKC